LSDTTARLGTDERGIANLSRETKRIASVLSNFARAFTGGDQEEELPEAMPVEQGDSSGGQGGKAKAAPTPVKPAKLPDGGEVTENITKIFKVDKK
jgi:hypothetical protein